MVIRIGGKRRKTRYVFRKEPRNKGKVSLTKYFQTFKDGEKVHLKAEPAIHKGMYFRRFNAKSGVINGKQGRCYFVKIEDGGKEKRILVHPIHITRYAQ